VKHISKRKIIHSIYNSIGIFKGPFVGKKKEKIILDTIVVECSSCCSENFFGSVCGPTDDRTGMSQLLPWNGLPRANEVFPHDFEDCAIMAMLLAIFYPEKDQGFDMVEIRPEKP
jgi:hypothetical protein